MNLLASMPLTEVQQQAVQTIDGPLLVIAGAGSGKTRVITCRIAWMVEQGIPPWQILAITFTNKAAGEMKERIRAMVPGEGVFAGTFHGFCARLLRVDAHRLGFRDGFSIYDAADQKSLVKKVVEELNLDSTQYPARTLLYQISKLKNEMTTPEEFSAAATGYQERNLARVYVAYQEALRDNNALDFDDLLLFTARLFAECPDVLERYQEQYRYILMDEYQDTNVAQFRILHMLAKKYRNLCVTGDPDQSIYSWRGATIRNIIDFTEHYPDAQVIKMEQNFRSTKTILKAANGLIRNNEQRADKTLWTENEEGEAVDLVYCQDARAEAQEIVRRIREVRGDGLPLSECAVFYRVNAISRHLEMALMDAELPYEIVGGLPFFQRKEIKDILAYLRLLSNPDDSVSIERIINVPPRAIGKTTIERLRAYSAQTRLSLLQACLNADQVDGLKSRALKSVAQFGELILRLREADVRSVTACIQRILEETEYEKYLGETQKADEDRVANLQQLLQAASEYDNTTPEGSLSDFLERVALISELDAWEESADRVVLMSLHSAKGLEFKNVHIVGMEQGLLPHSRSMDDPHEKEEERRLFYVGMTRARRKLVLTAAGQRDLWGPGERAIPSEFLDELPEALLNVVNKQQPAYSTSSYQSDTTYDTSYADPFYDDSSPAVELRPGLLVRHKVFGLGRIVSSQGYGAQLRVRVKFNAGGEKDLIAAYAKLELCD